MIAKALIVSISAIVSQYVAPPKATLLFAGDAMMHRGQLAAAKQADGTYDYSEYFQEVDSLVQAADFAVVNLETPLGGKPYAGYPCFCAPDEYADALTGAGFDFFLLANNHMLDRQDHGLRRTVDVLHSKEIPWAGAYRDKAQRDLVLPNIQDVNGFKIGFLNYTYGTNGIEAKKGAVVDYIDRAQIKKDIARTREAGAEILCVAVHWGVEYKLLPHPEQKSLANFLVKEGVDLVMGGHPHVIQPMEMRTDTAGRNQLVVYSLGNYISDMKTQDTRGGAMLQVRLGRDADGRAIVQDACYDLVFTVPGKAGGRNFRLVYVDECDDPAWQPACKAFSAQARKIFTEHNINVPERGR